MNSTSRAIQQRNDLELSQGTHITASWHDDFRSSAYIFVGGLPRFLTEGDILAVFSQSGEIVDLDLIRDESTGVSKGFCYLAYEDQRSTNLAVDNLNAFELCGSVLTVDHKLNYFKKEKKKPITSSTSDRGVHGDDHRDDSRDRRDRDSSRRTYEENDRRVDRKNSSDQRTDDRSSSHIDHRRYR